MQDTEHMMVHNGDLTLYQNALVGVKNQLQHTFSKNILYERTTQSYNRRLKAINEIIGHRRPTELVHILSVYHIFYNIQHINISSNYSYI